MTRCRISIGGSMIRIVIESRAPIWAAQGIKEDLAMHLERFGDCRVIEISEISGKQPQQAEIPGFPSGSQRLTTTM